MKLYTYCIVLLSLFSFESCQRQAITTWDENNPKQGGFQKAPYCEQETPIGLLLIEGREFTLKQDESVTEISSKNFYISKYEETNGQYLAYLAYLEQYYSKATYQNALPDTTFWNKLKIGNEDRAMLMNNYLRNPLYKDFPVIGLNVSQIERYAVWKSDRMNELILVREEVLEINSDAKDSSELFTTKAYLYGQYRVGEEITSLDPSLATRNVRLEDGILLPKYRLPTSQEWQLASVAIGDYSNRYFVTEKEYKFKNKQLADFGYLSVEPSKIRKPDQVKYADNILQLVYGYSSNSYGLHGLSNGIPEYAKDSTNSYLIGVSSISTQSSYSAVFCDSVGATFNYRFPVAISEPIEINNTGVSRLTGFRLAMTRVGTSERYKRKKGTVNK
ncbi:MAG: sulfatase activating formylglycine-generating enzyme [Flavobacteriaceae bacterium]|jgi:formylglycine-generating enzyme required for sulfatase activity